MDDFDDAPTDWISPPFSYVFLTAVKWVIAVLIVLGVLSVIGLIVFLLIGALWLS